MCGDRARQDRGQRVTGSGSREGPAQAQEFVSVPEGPRALLRPRSKEAAEERGAGCDI